MPTSAREREDDVAKPVRLWYSYMQEVYQNEKIYKGIIHYFFVFAGLGLLLFLIIIANRRLFVSLLYGGEIGSYPFVLPVGYLIYAVGMLVCALLMLKGRNSRHIGIEIASIILLFVIPRIQTIVSYVQSVVLSRYTGFHYSSSLATINAISQFAGRLSGIAAFLMLLACGLRIGYKKTKREQL